MRFVKVTCYASYDIIRPNILFQPRFYFLAISNFFHGKSNLKVIFDTITC